MTMLDAAILADAIVIGLIAAVVALALSNVVVYRRYRRAAAAGGPNGRQGKDGMKADAADGPAQDGPSGTAGECADAPAEVEVGSSGTFADLCEDGNRPEG